LETALPFMKTLEDQYLPKERFEKALLELIAY
jgi:2-oxoisovalerate dehydrogenase E1 component